MHEDGCPCVVCEAYLAGYAQAIEDAAEIADKEAKGFDYNPGRRKMLDPNQKELVTQAHCWTAEIEQRQIAHLYAERNRPFHHMRPRMFIDGDQWCCLYGDGIQDGLAGFGASPNEAANAFDNAFYAKIPEKTNEVPNGA